MTTTQSELERIVARRNARLSKQTTPSRKVKKAPASQPLHLRSVAPQCVVDAITRSIAIGRRT